MKAILLDAGGVLLDETEYEKRTCQLISEILARSIKGYSEKQYWKDIDESILRYSVHNRQYVFWKYCYNDISLFHSFWNDFKEAWRNKEPELKLMQGIEKELHQLSQNYRLLIAGQYGSKLISLLEKKELIHLFLNKLSQDDFDITKPDPRYLYKISKAAKVSCNECIMVGDRIDKDIIPAKQNGMGTVFLRTGIYKKQQPRTPDEQPDLILDAICGLADGINMKWRFS